MAKCLIIGNGRAGQRHAKMAACYGLEPVTVDNNAPADYQSLSQAMSQTGGCIAYAVIATPPASHLEYIAKLAGLPTLCEKPLCALGQLDSTVEEYAYLPVMVAYNWRYHPVLQDLFGVPSAGGWVLHSEQYRPGLPDWGLLLDHVAHDIDIIRQFDGLRDIHYCRHVLPDDRYDYEEWYIQGHSDSLRPFSIYERVWRVPYERRGLIISERGTTEIVPQEHMFHAMWQAFLSGQYWPRVDDAAETQHWLDVIDGIEHGCQA